MENNFKHNISENKKLGYSEQFKNIIHNNPGIIKDFFAIKDELKIVWQEKTLNNIHVELIEIRGLIKDNGYYHVTLESGEEFFVKSGTPYSELQSTEKAKELLKEMKGLRVIDFQAGYQQKNGEYLYVTKWENLPTLEKYLQSTDKNITLSEEKVSELEDRLSHVHQILGGDYFDVDERNCFYDKEKDELVLFDLTSLDFKNIRERTE